MAQVKKQQSEQPVYPVVVTAKGTEPPPRDSGDGGSKRQRVYDDTRRLLEAGDAAKAFQTINAAAKDDASKNLKGVCLLRMGDYEAALRLYRTLVLKGGTTWLRQDAPLVHKVNFATALLLSGHPAGCKDVLVEISQPDHPAVARLRAALKKWRASLSVTQKLLWFIGQEPAKPVTLDFPPGILEDEAAA